MKPVDVLFYANYALMLVWLILIVSAARRQRELRRAQQDLKLAQEHLRKSQEQLEALLRRYQ